MPYEVRVLVCGSRTFSHRGPIGAVLFGIKKQNPDWVTVIEGGAPGADYIAREWAEDHADEHLQFPANWDEYGKRAGPIRNQQMLDEGKPDVVWAFVDKPLIESRGTNNMVTLARNAGVPVRIVEVP